MSAASRPTQVKRNNMHVAAQNYASAGMKVFPLVPGEKKPIMTGGFHGATSDIGMLAEWWSKTPNANIGVATGRASGIFVLDVDIDPAKGIDGMKSLADLEQTYGELPQTWRQRSPRGGIHIFFRNPGSGVEIMNSASRIGAGLDIRGEGGYITMTPSETVRGTYRWEPKSSPVVAPLADAPAWLIDLLRPRHRITEIAATEISDQAIQIVRDPKFASWAANHADRVVTYSLENVRNAVVGTRNSSLFKAALRVGELMAFELVDEADMRNRLLQAAIEAGEEAGKAMNTIQSGISRGLANPRRLDMPQGSQDPQDVPSEVADVFIADVTEATREDGNYPFRRAVVEDIVILRRKSPQAFQELMASIGTFGVNVPSLVAAIDKSEADTVEGDRDPTKAPAEFHIAFLGRLDRHFYYRSRRSRDVVALAPRDHTNRNMMSIAPLDWWKKKFPAGGQGGIDWDRGADWLMDESARAGTFQPERIRGRGAWLDNGHVVFNAGDHLLVDGRAIANTDFDSRFIYEEGPQILSLAETKPLSLEEAKVFHDLCHRIRWSELRYGNLFAGWVMTSVIGGCLPWRAHLWLESSAGAGKSWIMQHILKPIIGPVSIAVQGDSTESGIRQTLGNDAIVVLGDEVESENERGQARVQGVLDLIRVSSSSNDARVVKGSASHRARTWIPRASFCLSSIGVMIERQSDARRICVLSMKPPVDRKADPIGWDADRQNFIEMQNIVAKHFDAGFGNRFIARAIKLAPKIVETSRLMNGILSSMTGSQHMADQLSSIYAGAWFLQNDEGPSIEQAREFLNKNGINPIESEGGGNTDHERCLSRILEHVLRADLPGGTRNTNISELIDVARGSDSVNRTAARDILGRHGLQVEDGQGLVISNTHSEVARMLTGTPWAAGKWGRILSHYRDASNLDGKTRRIGGSVSRVVCIPWGSVFPDEVKP